MSLKKLGIFFFFLFVFTSFAASQDTLQTGNIAGTVTDTEGNALPGVAVTLKSTALIRGTQLTTTTPTGTYRFIFLPVGTYEVTFEMPGFKTLVIKDVKISIRKTTTVNATLEVSTIAETITVTGQAPVVDTKSTTIATNFTLDMLQKIPSARDPWVILEMTPGMVMDRQNVGGSQSGQQSSAYAHGTIRSQTSYNIDGVNMTDTAANGASAMYYDFDSFEEIQVETGAHAADIQTGGIVLNMITKSGGNKFTIGLSTYGEQDKLWGMKLQSNNIPKDDPKYASVGSGNPLDYFYEYGGDVGGPILRDKLWFYGAFRRTAINTYVIGYMLNNVPQTDYTLLTHATFKLTYQLSSNNKLMGWFNFDDKKKPHRAAGPRRPPETTYYQNSPSYFYHLEDTWTLSPNLLLNFKLGINDMWYQVGPQSTVDMNKPALLIYYSQPYRSMYMDAYYQYTWYYSDRYQFNAFADYFKDDFLGGNHELKVGFEYQNSPFHTTRKHPGNITLYFDYYDYVNKKPYGPYRVWTFREEKWNQTNVIYSAYFQDTFTLKKRLTLSVGLRLDSTHMHVNETEVPSNPWVEYYAQRMGKPQTVQAPAKKNVISWNILSPRLGIIFDLLNDGNNILKANYSRYSYQMSYGPVDLAIETGYWEVDYSWNDANKDGQPQTSEFGKITYTNIAAATKIDPNLKSPYISEASVGFERRLTRNLGVSLNFIYRENKRFWWTDNLAIDPTKDYTPIQVKDPGPDGKTGTPDDGGNITIYNIASAKVGIYDRYVTQQPGYMTSYRGVELVVNKRYADKWQLMASATLGSFKKKIPLESTDDPNNREFNDNTPEWNDSPLIIKVGGSYELPWQILFGCFFNYRKGYPTQRYFTYSLNQGKINVAAEKFGSERYPQLAVLDLRLSKIISIGKYGKLEAIIDLFNAFNAVTTLDWAEESYSGFHTIEQVLAPRIFRFGIKYNF